MEDLPNSYGTPLTRPGGQPTIVNVPPCPRAPVPVPVQSAPSPAVLEAFGAAGPAVALPGGAGTSWRAGAVALKPLDTSLADLQWQEQLLTPLLGQDGVRVAAPRRSGSGDLVVEGWTSRDHLPGTPATGRWAEVVDAGLRFHELVSGAPQPAHLAARTDPWAVGDVLAWGVTGRLAELGPAAPAELLPEPLRGLDVVRRPLDLRVQVVHGDLTGNVLTCPGLPPAVIDLSPYWRPVQWATAVVVADALLWHDAGAQLADTLLPDSDGGQLLLRALLYRGVAAGLLDPGRRPLGQWARAAEVVRQRCGG